MKKKKEEEENTYTYIKKEDFNKRLLKDIEKIRLDINIYIYILFN